MNMLKWIVIIRLLNMKTLELIIIFQNNNVKFLEILLNEIDD